MALPESISLENTIKNTQISLEIFNVGIDNVGIDTKIDGSRYLPIPEEILTQHFSNMIYLKATKKDILDEFMFLYRNSTKEMILIPTKNYNKLLEISIQAGIGEEAKRFIEYFDNQKSIILIWKYGRYVTNTISIEFRPEESRMIFTAKNEPYINMKLFGTQIFRTRSII